MFNKIPFQKVILLACCVLTAAAVAFGAATRLSYSTQSKDKSSISKAEVTFEEDFAYQLDEMHSAVDYEQALAELEQNDYIFYAECLDTEICYGCIKYTIQVFQTLKGEEQEAGEEIVLYQLIKFDYTDDDVYFLSPDYSMPLQEGKTYLLFANKRDYDSAYQKTLTANEYSLAISGTFPTALVVDDTQSEYIHANEVSEYGDIEGVYYICFNEAALDNINALSDKIIQHYIAD